jgi:exonuclease SbcD
MSELTFIHTSDWHLGKRLFREERLEEQKAFLSWLIEQGKNSKADALIIAGDIFDTPIPPTEALESYFSFLKQWHEALPDSHIFVLAGNHDSGRFLEAPRPWLQQSNIYIVGNIDQFSTVSLKEDFHFHLLPYFRNSEFYKIAKNLKGFNENRWEEDEEYPTQLLKQLLKEKIKKGKNILISHHAFGPFSSSPSEQSITFSGKNTIPTEVYKDSFDYIALGHIHKYQKIGSTPPAYYSGSPIPFRFSESNEKKIILGSFKKDVLSLETIDIPLQKELHIVELDSKNPLEILEGKKIELEKLDKEIFLLVRVKMKSPISGINDQIQQAFKGTRIKVLNIQLHFEQIDQSSNKESIIATQSLDDIFKQFYKIKTGDENPSQSILSEFQELTKRIDMEMGD